MLRVELSCKRVERKRVHFFLKDSRLTLCGLKLAGHEWSPTENGSVPVCGVCLKKKALLDEEEP